MSAMAFTRYALVRYSIGTEIIEDAVRGSRDNYFRKTIHVRSNDSKQLVHMTDPDNMK